MDSRQYYELEEKLCKELETIAKSPKFDMGDVELINKLTDSIKNVEKIQMLKGDDYSQRGGNWQANGSYRNGSYNDGNSYGRHYVRGHYSRAEDDMLMDRMSQMMNRNDMSQSERDTISRAMDIMRR